MWVPEKVTLPLHSRPWPAPRPPPGPVRSLGVVSSSQKGLKGCDLRHERRYTVQGGFLNLNREDQNVSQNNKTGGVLSQRHLPVNIPSTGRSWGRPLTCRPGARAGDSAIS